MAFQVLYWEDQVRVLWLSHNNVNVKLGYIAEEQADEEEGEKDDKVTHGYAALIGSLMYLVIGTWPNIAFAMNKLAQFMQNPQPIH